MKKIYLNELLEKLGCKDIRTARRWCRANKVFIVRRCKLEFVYETIFNAAFDKPLIQDLQKRFPKDWETVYEMVKEGNVTAIYALNELSLQEFNTYQTKNAVVKEYQLKYRNFAKA